MASERFVFASGGLAQLRRLATPLVTEVTDAIEEDAKGIVPVRTGHLRDSIKSKVEQHGDSVVGTVYSDVDYAPDVELGTSKMRAEPYLAPALYKTRG